MLNLFVEVWSTLTNQLFRDNVRTRIDHAIQQAADAAGVGAPGLTGRIREIAFSQLFEPLLCSGCSIGTGLVVDSFGRQSRQMDLVIYSRSLLPSAMYNVNEGMFPAEACLYCIEIKSRTSATEIEDAIVKARSVGELRYRSGIRGPDGQMISHRITQIIPALFAFDSNLSPSGRTELERYRELDARNASGLPSVPVICVVGRGYWYWNAQSNEWFEHPSSRDHDEVIDFLSGVINTIPGQIETRGHPMVGSYLMTERSIRRIA